MEFLEIYTRDACRKLVRIGLFEAKRADRAKEIRASVATEPHNETSYRTFRVPSKDETCWCKLARLSNVLA